MPSGPWLSVSWLSLSGLTSRIKARVSYRTVAGGLSVALHLALLLVIVFSGGRRDGIDSGDVPTSQLLLIEALNADHRDGVDLPPVEPSLSTPDIESTLHADNTPPASPPNEVVAQDVIDATASPPVAPEPAPESTAITTTPAESRPRVSMSYSEKTQLTKQLAKLAEASITKPQAQVSWEQDGRQYSATFIQQRANEGTALDRVIAEVSTSDRGKQLTTRLNLKRLAFSQFTQMVDHWDPMVQIHDDTIVGRFHSNSQFNLMYDSRTAPQFLGKVTTAARSFNTESNGRRRDSDIFRGGIEMDAGRIGLPEELKPFEWAPREEGARVHELTNDTRIRFYADGSYTLRTRESADTQYVNSPSTHPVYFIAGRGVELFVKGTLAGKVLIYSPERIVIEGSLTYAHDPRTTPNATDYLGLVCDRYVEVAPPGVTGPGDVEINAAIFAGRRFVVTSIDNPRTATLRIYGSLAAGTLSATEPRYATKIDYDGRFETRRPPGFPSTNRFEVDEWDGQWVETAQHRALDSQHGERAVDVSEPSTAGSF
jgi:hypothetical protein